MIWLKIMKNKIAQTIFVVFIIASAVPLRADWPVEEEKIDFLLDQIGQVDGYFVRNGNDHSPESAVSHMRMKMDKAMNSWFAPDKDKWTAEMFIDKVASKSSMSGKPYKIRFKSGKIVNTGPWLRERLKEFVANESVP